MPYNITAWKTKTIKELAIPYAALQKWEDFEIEQRGSGVIAVTCLVEAFEVVGTLRDNNLIVESIEFWGEWSGSYWDDFQEMLAQSTGILIATQVWSGGDEITRLMVDNGSVVVEEIEI